MKKIIISAAIIICNFMSVGSLSAQIAGNKVYTNPGQKAEPVNLNIESEEGQFTSMLEANVMINVKATAYIAVFSLTQNGNTIEEAEAAMRSRSEIFKTMLKQLNIPEQDIFADPVSMVPVYETEVTEKKLSRTYNEVPAGYEIKKNIHITFHEQAQISDIISIAAKAEVYDLVKVDYIVNDKDAILLRLRQEAMRILMDKKAVFASAGLHVRFTNIGEMHGSANPAERYAQYTAYKTGLAPYYVSNAKKNVSVQYNYAEKQRTIYYDMVSDKQFDKVINPVVNEPMVQIYFSLKGQTTIYDPEVEAADKKYNERLRQLELEDRVANIEIKRRPQ